MLERDYLTDFIELNKDVLKFVYTIKVNEDEWFVHMNYDEGKKLDKSDRRIGKLGEVTTWTYYPDMKYILDEIAAMKECGFLEEE